MQARGDNLYSTVMAFAESSKLKNAHERESLGVSDDYNDERAVFFDYLTWFMVGFVQYNMHFALELFILG